MIINDDLKTETKQILMMTADNKQMGKSETTFGSWWLVLMSIKSKKNQWSIT